MIFKHFAAQNSVANFYQSCLLIHEFSTSDENKKLIQFLTDDELRLLNNLENDSAKKKYLSSRYVAKSALMKLSGSADAKQFSIRNGIFGQPIVDAKHFSNLQISISHSNKIFTAIAFFEDCPMALDVEETSSTKENSVISQMTNHEISKVIPAIKFDYPALVLWTAKEALAKALKTGLHIDFRLLEVEQASRHAEFIEGSFTNFSQYKFTSYLEKNFICTIVAPEKAYH